MSKALEQNATLSGFLQLATERYPNWTQQFLAEIEEILVNVYQHKNVVRMETFREDFVKHLYHDPEAHNLDITPWKDKLIYQLYIEYRRCGYTGSIVDMLFTILKIIEIATDGDLSLGISETKAINPPQWRFLFNKHDGRQKAHEPRFDRFVNISAMRYDVAFSFNHMFPENYAPFITDGYTLNTWNHSSGTLHFEFIYDVNFNNIPTYPLLTFKTMNGEEAKIVLKNDLVYLDTPTTRLRVPFSYTPEGIEKVVLTYNQNSITLRDQLTDETVYNKDHFFRQPMVSMFIDQPLQQIGSPVAVREVTYYPTDASREEQVFFLN